MRRSFFPFNALGMPSFNNSVEPQEKLEYQRFSSHVKKANFLMANLDNYSNKILLIQIFLFQLCQGTNFFRKTVKHTNYTIARRQGTYIEASRI